MLGLAALRSSAPGLRAVRPLPLATADVQEAYAAPLWLTPCPAHMTPVHNASGVTCVAPAGLQAALAEEAAEEAGASKILVPLESKSQQAMQDQQGKRGRAGKWEARVRKRQNRTSGERGSSGDGLYVQHITVNNNYR